LKFFAVPQIKQIIEAGEAEDKVSVHIILCPVMGNPSSNRKLTRSLESMCLEKDISFFIGRNTGFYIEGGLSHIESRIERGSIDEIKAIKDLGALIKLSSERNVNLLKRSMCFIGESIGYQYISTMSEEAAAVMIYEHGKMDDVLKKSIFERLMAEKGISAVFTKDLRKAVSQSEIILADSSVELQAIQESLSGKILIGDNTASGDFEKVGKVLLWYESIEKMSEDNIYLSFNNELLSILRHFYREKSTVDFIRRFPYIYFSRKHGADMFQSALTSGID
jgi:hypothetical protein